MIDIHSFGRVVTLAAASVALSKLPLVETQATSVAGQVAILERPGEKTEDLANTVVFLEVAGGAAVKTAPATTTIAMQSRAFSPHIRVVPQGSKVSFPNQDPFSHNVFSKAKEGPFDLDSYGRGKSKDNTFKQAGIYPIFCNVHPRMTAFVLAMNTPYFAQAGADGRFSIDKVPPGKYVIHVWHERTPEQVSEITVAASGLAGLKYQLDAKNYKYVQHKNKFGKDYVNAGDIY